LVAVQVTQFHYKVARNVRAQKNSDFRNLDLRKIEEQITNQNEIPNPPQDAQIFRLASASALPGQMDRCDRSQTNAVFTRKAITATKKRPRGNIRTRSLRFS